MHSNYLYISKAQCCILILHNLAFKHADSAYDFPGLHCQQQHYELSSWTLLYGNNKCNCTKVTNTAKIVHLSDDVCLYCCPNCPSCRANALGGLFVCLGLPVSIFDSRRPGCCCISLLMSRLPMLPIQCYSNRKGNLGNLSSNKEIQVIFLGLYLCNNWFNAMKSCDQVHFEGQGIPVWPSIHASAAHV